MKFLLPAACEKRVAILTMKRLIPRWSGSVLNKMLTFAARALIHGANFEKIPRLHNHDVQKPVDMLRSQKIERRRVGYKTSNLGSLDVLPLAVPTERSFF